MLEAESELTVVTTENILRAPSELQVPS